MMDTLVRETEEDRPRQSHTTLAYNNDSSQMITDNTRSYRELDDRKRSSSRLESSIGQTLPERENSNPNFTRPYG